MSLLLIVVDRQAVLCPTLPVVTPSAPTDLPVGSLYGTYRRQVAQAHPEGALLQEAGLEANDFSWCFPREFRPAPDQRSAIEAPPEPGQEWLKTVRVWDKSYVTRFYGYLPHEHLRDLVFDPAPTTQQYLTQVERWGWQHEPWWRHPASLALTLPPLGLISLLLVGWRRRRERRRGIAPTWSPLTLELLPAVIAGLMALVCYIAEWPGGGRWWYLWHWRNEWHRWSWSYEMAPAYVPAVATGVILAALTAGWSWQRLRGANQVALKLAGFGVAAVTLLAWTLLAGHVFVRGAQLGLVGDLSVLRAEALDAQWTLGTFLLVPLVLTSLWNAAALGRVKQRTPRLAVGRVVLLLELVPLLGTSWSIGTVLAQPRYHDTYSTHSALVEAQEQLADAAQDYLAKHGVYPRSVGELVGYGETMNVARKLHTKPAAGPLREVPLDPLTGRPDTWIIDPLDPSVVDSGGWQVRVSAIRLDQYGRQ